jgi:hypothetical protein
MQQLRLRALDVSHNLLKVRVCVRAFDRDLDHINIRI